MYSKISKYRLIHSDVSMESENMRITNLDNIIKTPSKMDVAPCVVLYRTDRYLGFIEIQNNKL